MTLPRCTRTLTLAAFVVGVTAVSPVVARAQSGTTGSSPTGGPTSNPGNIAGNVFNLTLSGNSSALALENFIFGPNNSILVRGMFSPAGSSPNAVSAGVLEGRTINGSSFLRELTIDITDSDSLAVGDSFISQTAGARRASLVYTENQPPGNWVSSGTGTVQITGLQLLGGASGRIALDFSNVQLTPLPRLGSGTLIINGSVNVSL